MNNTYDLQRFIQAQKDGYESVLNELRSGLKVSHWMWHIFPQIIGLGQSNTANIYAIVSREEAMAYSNHPLLGSRLRECTLVVLNIEGRSAEQIFHYPDVLKFRSCMTLFEQTATDNIIFYNALVKYFNGEPDQLTIDILERQ